MRSPRHRESRWQNCESIPLWLDKRDSLHGRGSMTLTKSTKYFILSRCIPLLNTLATSISAPTIAWCLVYSTPTDNGLGCWCFMRTLWREREILRLLCGRVLARGKRWRPYLSALREGVTRRGSGHHLPYSGGNRREGGLCVRSLLLRRWIRAQHLPPELFECHAGAYRGGDASPWRHAEPEGLMAVATRQEWQDDGNGDQDDDNPLQYLHTSSGGLIGHFFINAL